MVGVIFKRAYFFPHVVNNFWNKESFRILQVILKDLKWTMVKKT